MSELNIVHMASYARSGETLLQRIFSAHSRVRIGFDLNPRNSDAENRLRALMTDYAPLTIARDHPIFSERVGEAIDVLFVKQGVWRHPHPFNGFILARNPVSVIASLIVYDGHTGPPEARSTPDLGSRKWWRRRDKQKTTDSPPDYRWERLLRWQKDFDDSLLNHISSLDFVSACCAQYVNRMLPLTRTRLPIFHYETIVADPERQVKAITDAIGLDFEPTMLRLNESASDGHAGHGKIDFARPIDQRSLSSYQRTIDQALFDKICALTHPAWAALGYRMRYGAIEAPPGAVMS